MHCILAFLSSLAFSPSVHDVCNKQMVGGLCVDGIQSLEAKKVYALVGVSTSTIKSQGSLSIDSLSGSSSYSQKIAFSETNMQSSLGYLP